VSFDGGDGSGTPPPSQTVEADKSITLPRAGSLVAPANKEFVGWKAGGVSYSVGDPYIVRGDVTFIAQWKDIVLPTKEYTLAFDGGDGSGTPPAPQTVEENKSISLPGKAGLVAPANKEFAGWKTGGVSYAEGDSYTVTGNVTFIAQWKDQAVSYTVTFDSDGGNPARDTRTVTSSGGTVGALPDKPTKTDHTFEGWYTEKNGGGAAFTATTPVTKDLTVYAKWKMVNPFVGGIWLDSDAKLNYKFTDDNVYSTANHANFVGQGTYEFTSTRLTLKPEKATQNIYKYYKINKSQLIFGEGTTDETRYTRNPETSGGFNGDPGPAPLGGMWQNIDPAKSTDCFAFNKGGEFFWPDIEKNSSGKFWWHAMGTYEYVGSDLILTYYDTAVNAEPKVYTVVFTLNNTRMKLTEDDGSISEFDKKDNI
jgi:uncharacterized repeat protein (TIGR02543 family)